MSLRSRRRTRTLTEPELNWSLQLSRKAAIFIWFLVTLIIFCLCYSTFLLNIFMSFLLMYKFFSFCQDFCQDLWHHLFILNREWAIYLLLIPTFFYPFLLIQSFYYIPSYSIMITNYYSISFYNFTIIMLQVNMWFKVILKSCVLLNIYPTCDLIK